MTINFEVLVVFSSYHCLGVATVYPVGQSGQTWRVNNLGTLLLTLDQRTKPFCCPSQTSNSIWLYSRPGGLFYVLFLFGSISSFVL